MSSTAPALRIDDLEVVFDLPDAPLRAVRGATLDVRRGGTLGVVGESGSGKSVTALSVLDLVPHPGHVVGGSIEVGGDDVTGLDDRQHRALRGGDVAMVFQDPTSSLNPLLTVGRQLVDVMLAHPERWPGTDDGDHRARAVELLTEMGLPTPGRRMDAYPHELSGGMRQRVMLAMALANRPTVLLADEPTTALDVTIQAQILELLRRLNRDSGTAIVLISHNLGVVAEVCEHLVVMYAGQVVESGATADIFSRPLHPYAAGLLAAMPRADADASSGRLATIPGQPPSLAPPPVGCAFADRCPHRHDRCVDPPPLAEVVPGRLVRCWLPASVDRVVATDASVGPTRDASHPPGRRPSDVAEPPLVELAGVHTHLRLGRAVVRAVDGVTLTIGRGETVALVGESGCGKTTLGRTLLGLRPATSGSVRFDGVELVGMRGEPLRRMRRRMQMVFQDPLTSLDPRMRLGDIVAEPLLEHDLCGRREAQRRVDELFDVVALPRDLRDRRPFEVSGGQRQRVGIARAIATGPDLVVADEALASLDISIAGQIVNLMADLQRDLGVSYLMISHDLATVRHASRRVAVMYLGRIVELADTASLFASPAHPYTVGLLASTPSPDPAHSRSSRPPAVVGEPPDPTDPPSGCRFRTRCPVGPLADPDRTICIEREPELRQVGPGRWASCHFAAGTVPRPTDHLVRSTP